ncbi:methyltransferase domain-containing protein [Streptomyces sp. NBC_00989]|uniref:class I SAM-dependent methyltransferase n=1 Tax=Streptomyces sp. NBC_00989 TaxID=2903705 RepID=UPI002F908023|nr:methyltransferase domain-containing protein [Streptomyces sp. NBC_00989]
MTTTVLRTHRLSAADWNQWAASFPPVAVSPAESALFQQAATPHPGMTAIDLACGTGQWTRQLASWGITVTGYDFSDEALGQAQAAAPREGLSYALWDIVADPIPGLLAPGSLDMVTCRYGLPYLEPGRLLTDVGRWLKPDGVFSALVRVTPDPDRDDATERKAHDSAPVDPASFDLGLTEAHLSDIGAGWARHEVHHLDHRLRMIVLSGYGSPPPQQPPPVNSTMPAGLKPPGQVLDDGSPARPVAQAAFSAAVGHAHGDPAGMYPAGAHACAAQA